MHALIGIVVGKVSFLVIPYKNYTVWHKIMTVENIDKFNEIPAIRQYFPHQNFPLASLLLKFVARHLLKITISKAHYTSIL